MFTTTSQQPSSGVQVCNQSHPITGFSVVQ